MYCKCMSRTNIDIDEDACRVVMRRYHFATKRDAVNFAFRTTAGEPLSVALRAECAFGRGVREFRLRSSNHRPPE